MAAVRPANPAETSKWGATRCLVYHAALVLVVVGLYFMLDPSPLLITAGALVGPYFFLMVYVESKKAPLKISPISVYFFWQSFALGVAAIYAGFQISDGSSLTLSGHMLNPGVVATGYLIGVIGTLFLHAGMQVTRPKPQAVLTPLNSREVLSLMTRFGLLYGMGLCILFLASKLRFMGTLTSSFEFAAHAALVGFVLIPKDKLKLPESSRLGVVLLGTLFLLLASTSAGAKLYFMMALVGLLVYVLQNRNFKRHLPLAGVVILLFYLSVVAPTVTKSRELRARYQVGLVASQIEGFKEASPLYTGVVDKEFYAEQMETLLRRQFEATSIAFIVREVQVRGFLYGENFYQVRYALIPRIFWSEKPWVIRGGWFTSYIGSSPREQDSTYSVGMEAAGELYWNFGILGVTLGMFVIGSMIGGLWRMAGYDPRMEPLRLSLYIYISLGMMNLPEAASRMVSCISLFLIYGTIFFLIRPHQQTKAVVFQRTQFSPPI